MKEVMTFAHMFLQAFVMNNPQNQAILHLHIDKFLVLGNDVNFIIFVGPHQ